MVARQVGTEGVAGGELRGGDGFGWIWGPGLWWFPNALEGLSGSARLRGRGWWHWEGKGAPATANLAEGRRRPKLPEAEKTVVSEEFERGVHSMACLRMLERGLGPFIAGEGRFRRCWG